jgi:ADP-ribosylglycohydrolase
MKKDSPAKWSGQLWNQISREDLAVEREQCADEGRDIASLAAELDALLVADLKDPDAQERACALLDRTREAPALPGYPFREPSDLPGIRAERPAAVRLPGGMPDGKAFLDKALGAWQGRASGCLLGAAVEGRRAWQIEKYLMHQDRWPLSDYFSNKADPDVARECGFSFTRAVFKETITAMVEDDDTNYTVLALALLTAKGGSFTPDDMAHFWLENLPYTHVCTAERSAYRNFIDCIAPPDSALWRNPYREWIGAQIRADLFGYVCPADPERAAEYAWRDACISHVKNGIYGEMWAAAMLAAAFACDDLTEVIRAGLAQVPAACRLSKAVDRMIGLHESGADYTAAVKDIRERWDETNQHHWCHTISNAEIVVLALLWGGKDFERTVCGAVMPGFDTDCNAATAGSVLGAILGARKLPGKWIKPMRDTLFTGMAGYNKVSLTQMARETVALAGKLGK